MLFRSVSGWVRVQHAALRWMARRSSYLQRLGVIKHGFAAVSVTRYLCTPRRILVRDVRSFMAAMEGGAARR